MEIFSTEVAGTYYSPPSKGAVPIGKLYSCYTNLRNFLASVGLIARETRNSGISAQVVLDPNPVLSDEADESLKALQQDSLENFTDIRSAWTETAHFRDNLLSTDITTAEYLHKFPVLSHAEGFELVSYFILLRN